MQFHSESGFAKLWTPISSLSFITGDGIATPHWRDVSLLGMNISASVCFGGDSISNSCVISFSLVSETEASLVQYEV